MRCIEDNAEFLFLILNLAAYVYVGITDFVWNVGI
jgi:hypothetical protein